MNAKTVESYIDGLPIERIEPMKKLRAEILKNLPVGYAEKMGYGMIGYVVPFDRYPQGYHVDSSQELSLLHMGSMKNHIALYHYGLYLDLELLNWFKSEYQKYSKQRLDIGKSCIRFKKIDEIPYGLIGEMMRWISVEQWIILYEKQLRSSLKR